MFVAVAGGVHQGDAQFHHGDGQHRRSASEVNPSLPARKLDQEPQTGRTRHYKEGHMGENSRHDGTGEQNHVAPGGATGGEQREGENQHQEPHGRGVRAGASQTIMRQHQQRGQRRRGPLEFRPGQQVRRRQTQQHPHEGIHRRLWDRNRKQPHPAHPVAGSREIRVQRAVVGKVAAARPGHSGLQNADSRPVVKGTVALVSRIP